MRLALLAIAVSAVSISSCGRPVENSAGMAGKGRYVGVGHYAPGRMWSQIVRGDGPSNAAAAKASDDEQVIIVMDSNTGELRQCGNLSGFCIGMNPWSKPLSAAQTAPLAVAKHAAEIEAQSAAAAPGR